MSVAAPSLLRVLGGVLPESMSPDRLAVVSHALRGAGTELTTLGHTKPQRPGEQGFVVSRLVDAARGVDTLVVDKHQQGPAEVAGSTFAGLIGLDHFVPLAVPQAADGARMLFRPGVELRKLADVSAEDLVQIRAARLARVAPQLDVATRQRVAKMEIELLQTIDYLLANSDRHRGNILVDIATGEISFIDQGAIGDGEFWQKFTGGSPLRPKLNPLIQGADGHTSLSTDTIEWLTSRLDDQVIDEWMAGNPLGTARLTRDGVVDRLGEVMRRGSFDYAVKGEGHANRIKPASVAGRKAF